MDAIWLPVMDIQDRLDDSVVAMHDSKRSGLLTENEGEYKIVHVGGVLAALDRGMKTLGEVDSADVVHIANTREATKYKVDLVRPLRTGHQYEALLDSVHREYSVVAHASGVALVVTRHESLREILSHYNTYYCDGPTTHYFPKPIVMVGSDCPRCIGIKKGKIHLKA